jgi:hypothetical protein
MHEKVFYAETQVEAVMHLNAQKTSSRTKYNSYFYMREVSVFCA